MIGRIVSHYRIVADHGGGAMGHLYRAEDLHLGRPVAVKFLPRDLETDAQAPIRFQREARAASAADHPNICTILEIDQTEDGRWFIVMAWCEGRSLKDLQGGGPLAPRRALEIAVQVARGLARAHELGIVHRDIKPANLMVDDRGGVKIVDFGLARMRGETHLTRSGTILGTPAYMSPEQAEGRAATPASDLWALGAVLYEMLTGRPPFAGDTDLAVLNQVLTREPPHLTGGDHTLKACGDIVERCLTRDPARRYTEATLLAADLETLLAAERIRDPDGDSGPRTLSFRMARRRRRLTLLAVGLAVGLAAAAAYWLARPGPAREGVAILPFGVAGADSLAAALGNGLSWALAEQLCPLENQSERFWIVPPRQPRRLDLNANLEAVNQLGVRRSVSGSGLLAGNRLTLALNVLDAVGHRQVTLQFDDDLANLGTWQRELPRRLMTLIDPGCAAAAAAATQRPGTTVPGAFRDGLTGLGLLVGSGTLAVDPDRAEVLLNRAVAQDSSYARAWAGLGELALERFRDGDTAQAAVARRWLQRAAAIDPTLVPVHLQLGRLATREGRFEEAEAAYERGLAADPRDAACLSYLGSLLRRQGRIQEAEAVLTRATALRPGYFLAQNDLGSFCFRLARYDEAAACFDRVIALNPGNVTGYTNSGAALFEAGRAEEAKRRFEQSLTIHPTFMAYSNLATSYYYEGRFPDAVDMCRNGLALDPDDSGLWNVLANSLYWTPGARDSSRAAFLRAADLTQEQLARLDGHGDSEEGMLLSTLATYQASLGDSSAARTLLERLEDWQVLEVDALFNVASAYEELGQREDAWRWLERAAAADLSRTRLEGYPGLRNLRSHPRFHELFDR